MTFLVALNCIMLFGLWALFNLIQHAGNHDRINRSLRLAIFLGTTTIGMAFFLLLVGRQWPPQMWGIELLLAASVTTAAACGGVVFLNRRSGRDSHFGAAGIAALCASLYLAFTAIDNLAFQWDAANTGYLDAAVAADAGIRCEHGYVLVKLDPDQHTATYRCPTNIVLGNALAQPFVPWPAYREGVSAELARTIAQVRAGAHTLR